MEIIKVTMNEFGCYVVNDTMTVPPSAENRYYPMVQKWIADGNTPTPYVEPEPHWIDKRLADKAKGGYGSIGEQLEMIGEQGMDVYQSHIAKIKAKYPKE